MTDGVDDWITPGQPAQAQASGADDWMTPQPANQTTVAKMDTGVVHAAPSTFRQAPTSAGIEPRHFSRLLNGMMKGYAGVDQLMGHVYGGEWAAGADERARRIEEEGRDLAAHAGVSQNRTDWWNMAGEVASPVNWAAGEGAAALPLLSRAAKASTIARGAIQGAGMAAAQPVTTPGDYWGNKGEQVATGAVVGGVVAPVLSGLGAVAKPAVSQAVRTLADEGVRVTPGQALGGLWHRIEDTAQSYPFVGQLVRSAREKSVEDFQRAAANKSLREIGETVSPRTAPGPDLINEVEDKISAAYQRIHPNVSLRLDQQLGGDLAGILQRSRAMLPDPEQQQLIRLIDGQVHSKIANAGGTAGGNLVQTMTSEIGRAMKGYSRDPSYDKRILGGYLADVREALSNAIERQNPQFSEPLQRANAAWRLYAKIRDAASKPFGETGQFGPAQLLRSSVKGETQGAAAKGKAPLQDLAAAGKDVLPSKVPDSGTPERSALLALPHIIAGGGLHAAGGPFAALAPGALIAALYNPMAQWALRHAILTRPAGAQSVRSALRMAAPRAGGLAAALNAGQQP